MIELFEIKNLPLPDLRQEVRKQLKALEVLGFPVEQLASLVSATDYRRDVLFAELVRTHERETGVEVSGQEQRVMFQQFAAKYDGLNDENLAETLRYQHDRETRESDLDRPLFPEPESQEYENIRRIMFSLGMYLKELKTRILNFSEFQETLKVLSTTPDSILQQSLHLIQRQLNNDMSDEDKAGEIRFSLDILLRDLNKSKKHGDELASGLLSSIEQLIDRVDEAYEAQSYSAVSQMVDEFLANFGQ